MKTGVSVRQFTEDVAVPPNSYAVGTATYFYSTWRDARGYSEIRGGARNNQSGKIQVQQAFTKVGEQYNHVTVLEANTILDPGGSGTHAADFNVPITRKYIRVTFVADGGNTLGDKFEIGAYLIPRS